VVTGTRLRVAAAATFLLLTLAFAIPRLGTWLVIEDPLTKADAIFVLGGTRFERPLEAADLYLAGWAPIISLVEQGPEWAEGWLADKGVTYETELQTQVRVLQELGVPAESIRVIDPQDSTAAEADALLATMRRQGWSSVIVVTSKQHTRRAGLSMRRAIGNEGRVIMRASRYDQSDTDRWWTNRATIRFTLFETQRLFAYWVGLAD